VICNGKGDVKGFRSMLPLERTALGSLREEDEAEEEEEDPVPSHHAGLIARRQHRRRQASSPPGSPTYQKEDMPPGLAEEIASWHAARVRLMQVRGMMAPPAVNHPVVQAGGHQMDFLVDDLWQEVYVPEPPKKVFDTLPWEQMDVAPKAQEDSNQKATRALLSPKQQHDAVAAPAEVPAAVPVARQKTPEIADPLPDITDEYCGLPERPAYQASEISFLLNRVGQTLGGEESRFSMESDHREEDENRQADLAARLKVLAQPPDFLETPTNEEAMPEQSPDFPKFATSSISKKVTFAATETTASPSNLDDSKGPQGAKSSLSDLVARANSTHAGLKETVAEQVFDFAQFARSNGFDAAEEHAEQPGGDTGGLQGAKSTPVGPTDTNNFASVLGKGSVAEPVFEFAKSATASMSRSTGFDASEQRPEHPVGDTEGGLRDAGSMLADLADRTNYSGAHGKETVAEPSPKFSSAGMPRSFGFGAGSFPTDLTANANSTNMLDKASMNSGWSQGDPTYVPDRNGGRVDSLHALVMDSLSTKSRPAEHRPPVYAANSRPPLNPSAPTPVSMQPLSPAKQQQQQQQQQASNFLCHNASAWQQDGRSTRCTSEARTASLTPRVGREHDPLPVAMTSHVQRNFDPSFRHGFGSARHKSASPTVVRGRQRAAHRGVSPRSSMPSTARPHARSAAAGVAIVYGGSK